MCFTSHVGLQAAFDADWQAGRITSDSYRNGTEDGALAYKLLIQTGSKKEPFNYSQVCPRATRNTFNRIHMDNCVFTINSDKNSLHKQPLNPNFLISFL